MTASPAPQSDALSAHPLPEVGVVVVAAGKGERLGAAIPKAFVELGGRSLLEHCVRTIVSLEGFGHLVLVVPGEAAAEALETVDKVLMPSSSWNVSVVAGGRERHESVRFGLDALTESVATVLIHDAARPLASVRLFEAVRAEVHRSRAGVVPAVTIADTIKRVNDRGDVLETIDRSTLVAVQTPQGFLRDDIVSAHERAQLQDGALGAPTDDAEVLQRAGGRVRVIPGEDRALKVTTPHDLTILEAYLETAHGGAS